ncbi:hypothetical protein [Terriglobus sp.]|uniref:hypothetical protein n=1 Tax=Terriglobus sp. TaxID=1889013 RepID=UPI003AFFE525
MKAPLPDRIARIADVSVAAVTLMLSGMMLWDYDPGARSVIVVFVVWAFGWAISFVTAPRHPHFAWSVRLVLTAAYFVDAAWDWRKANGETHAYMMMAAIPLAALLLFYLVLFALAATVRRHRPAGTPA